MMLKANPEEKLKHVLTKFIEENQKQNGFLTRSINISFIKSKSKLNRAETYRFK